MGAAGGAPRVGQPSLGVWTYTPASPVLPLYSPWRELGVDRKCVCNRCTHATSISHPLLSAS